MAKSEKDLSAIARATWLKAMAAFELKNYGYAIQLARTVLRETPDFIAARQMARKAAVAKKQGKKASFFSGISGSSFSVMKVQGLVKKDPAAAMEAVETILENDPYNAQANNLLKDAALALNMVDVAAMALETITEGNPKDAKPLHELARLYVAHDMPEKAVEVYGRILESTPNDLVAMKGGKDAAAKASMKQGGWETADSYRDLIKDKDTAIALEQQNRVVKDEETIDKLLSDLYQQIQEEPENVDKKRRMAELYEQKGEIENAIYYYEEVAAMLKGADPAIVQKVVDLKLKQIDICIEWRKNFIQENGPDHPESQQFLKEIEELKRQHAGFELDEAKRRVERNPTDLTAKFELGEILVRAGQFQEAIPELQRAQQNPHARIKAMSLLAKCYMAKSMLDLAAKTLESAASELASMDGIKKDLLYNLGLVYEKMGQKEKSLGCFKQIYEVDYGYRDVAQRVESSYGEGSA